LGLKESNAKMFPRGTVLIALTGATTGKTAILDMKLLQTSLLLVFSLAINLSQNIFGII
jgi:hypothetical protein